MIQLFKKSKNEKLTKELIHNYESLTHKYEEKISSLEEENLNLKTENIQLRQEKKSLIDHLYELVKTKRVKDAGSSCLK